MRAFERTSAPGGRAAGFTMIEALVAMTVLVLLAAVLLRAAVALRRDANGFSDDASRTLVARTVLDDALRNRKLRDGTYQGRRDGWPWTLTATRADFDDQIAKPRSGGGAGVAPPPAWRPQRLVVTIGAQGAPIALETLRLVTP